MRRLILLSALLLTACPLPYCPVRPIPPNAPKLHTKAPSSTAFTREKQSESKPPDGDTMRIGSECITVHNRTLTLRPCRNMPNQPTNISNASSATALSAKTANASPKPAVASPSNPAPATAIKNGIATASACAAAAPMHNAGASASTACACKPATIRPNRKCCAKTAANAHALLL